MKHGNSLLIDYVTYFFEQKGNTKEIDIDLNFKSISNKLIGYIDLIAVSKGEYEIVIDKDAGLESVLNYLAHELTHIWQVINGNLKTDNEFIIWNGENFISIQEYNEVVKHIDTTVLQYLEFPWEKEASENQKIFLKNYLTSQNFVNFGSKIIEPNLKFIVEMLSEIIVKEEPAEVVSDVEEVIQDVEVAQEMESDSEVSANLIEKPSHLMTLEEYQKTVSPLIKEYRAFIRKNEQWFVATDFNGLVYYSLEEAIENAKNNLPIGYFKMFADNWRKETPEQHARRIFIERLRKDEDSNYIHPPTPINLIEKKKELMDELSKYFTKEELSRRVEKDELNSNKRSIRRAIDNKTYTQLLIDGKVTFEELQSIGKTAGVNIPASVMPKKDFADFTYKKQLNKIIENLPRQSKEQLTQLAENIQIDLKPLEQEIFDREMARFTSMINEYKNSEIDIDVLKFRIPIWGRLFNSENELKKIGDKKFITLLDLRFDWDKQLRLFVFEYVATLKWKLVLSVLNHFEFITKPIQEINRLAMRVGNGKFEGTYQFVFEDGSYFNMVTESIGAGGYNIQAFHFRYITKFEDITLKNGEKVRFSNYNLINNFSVKK